jgi:hypothetical protein
MINVLFINGSTVKLGRHRPDYINWRRRYGKAFNFQGYILSDRAYAALQKLRKSNSPISREKILEVIKAYPREFI